MMGSNLMQFVEKSTYLGSLEYIHDQTHAQFVWVDRSSEDIPSAPGIYFILSENKKLGKKTIQKIGKAEGAGGLRQRFLAYTSKKSIEGKVLKDRTDLKWYVAMSGALQGEKLQVYVFVTKPEVKVVSIGNCSVDIELHWARSLEKELSLLARKEGFDKDGMLLAGNLN